MSKAFVQGKDRPTLEKPEQRDVPPGYVKLRYHGRIPPGGKSFVVPMPFAANRDGGGERVSVEVDPKTSLATIVLTEKDAAYCLALSDEKGPFTKMHGAQLAPMEPVVPPVPAYVVEDPQPKAKE